MFNITLFFLLNSNYWTRMIFIADHVNYLFIYLKLLQFIILDTFFLQKGETFLNFFHSMTNTVLCKLYFIHFFIFLYFNFIKLYIFLYFSIYLIYYIRKTLISENLTSTQHKKTNKSISTPPIRSLSQNFVKFFKNFHVFFFTTWQFFYIKKNKKNKKFHWYFFFFFSNWKL